MQRFSFIQVQDYAHSAGLHVAKFSDSPTSAYRFKVFDEPKDFLEDDGLFETGSLAEIVAFVRGYRKAAAKFFREAANDDVPAKDLPRKPAKRATKPQAALARH